MAFGQHVHMRRAYVPRRLYRHMIVLPDLQPLLVFVADATRVLLLCWYFVSTSQVTGTNQ